ncbi:MAG: hypothetical protein ACR2OI_11220 [Acidimicrobiia bacterium]
MWKSLLLLVLILAGCSGSSSDGPQLTFADFNSPATPEVLSGSSSSSTTSTPPSSTTTSSTTSTTLLVINAPGPVSIMTDQGLSILEGSGAPTRLVETPVGAGFEDLQGGYVFQLPGAGSDPAADQRIFWSRAAKPDAQPFLDVEDGYLMRLWGTAMVAGSPQMILTIADDSESPGELVERLILFDFESGDRVLGEVGGDGHGPEEIRYGGGRFLLDQRAGVQSFFEFRNEQGAVISLDSNPQTGCAEEAACRTHPALDPSGSFLAYLDPTDGDHPELVVLDLDLDEETRRIGLPGDLGEVLGLEFSGETVFVNRVNPAGEQRAVIVDVTESSLGEFGLEGYVRFLRQEADFEGPISILTD